MLLKRVYFMSFAVQDGLYINDHKIKTYSSM